MITPALNSEHRLLFDRAIHTNDVALAHYISAGGLLEQAASRLGMLSCANDPDGLVDAYDRIFKPLHDEYLAEQQDAIEACTTDDQELWHRAALLRTLAPQLVLLPKLFSIKSCAAANARRQLINNDGLYGLMSDVLAEVVACHDGTPVGHTDVRNSHVGQINELTALALLNRQQSSGFAALPSLPAEDILHQRDITAYFNTKGPNQRAIQVKSDENRSIISSQPNQLLYVGGLAMGNGRHSHQWQYRRGRFATAKVIIAENNGDAPDSDTNNVEAISTRLESAVRSTRHFISDGNRSVG